MRHKKRIILFATILFILYLLNWRQVNLMLTQFTYQAEINQFWVEHSGILKQASAIIRQAEPTSYALKDPWLAGSELTAFLDMEEVPVPETIQSIMHPLLASNGGPIYCFRILPSETEDILSVEFIYAIQDAPHAIALVNSGRSDHTPVAKIPGYTLAAERRYWLDDTWYISYFYPVLG